MRVGFKDKSDDEINNALNATVALFRFLQNKDEFEEWYKTHLQKRLLGNKTASDDAEKLMIVKLKSECGFQFTSKLEGMFNDLRVSQELMSRYRLYQQSSSASMSSPALSVQEACDIDVTVLTKVNWPGARYAPCPLPKEVKAAAESFSNYYLSHHTGRKIVWHTEKGTADVIFHTATKRFELTVSTWQMCVLSLFNDSANSAVSFGEMTAALPGVPREELQRHVLSLSTPKMRILLKNGKGKEIIDDDVFTINAAFESRLLKIKVPLVSMRSAVQSGATGASQAAIASGEAGGAPGGGGGMAGGQAADEEGDVIAQVENQRKNMIEASIVRIMKSRRTLDHANLVAEVTRQLGGRFKPTQQHIKKRIESLLEREYLERDKDDRRIYSYLA
jgi:cullin 3